ncbi:molecular chaperone DnaJ [Mycolicibacterium llatzerense]|nr:molecular chaperone DnaJ [Mycolicibacterium llatzerense]
MVLHIESSKGPLSYPCDKFTRWQDNLRAIALGLEALRKISRYGITPGDEQYAGWRAIPQQASGPAFTVTSAEAYLRSVAGEADEPSLGLETRAQVYRRARRNTHPDRNGGDQSQWDRVEAAADFLRAAGRL